MAALGLVCCAAAVPAQDLPTNEDTRTQYPAFLANSYFTFNVGSMRYIFSDDQLSPGYRSESVDIPHLAARVDLFGHHFTKHLAAQVTYMRPAWFVAYNNINGIEGGRQVRTAYGGFTLVWETPVSERVSAYGEGGLGI